MIVSPKLFITRPGCTIPFPPPPLKVSVAHAACARLLAHLSSDLPYALRHLLMVSSTEMPQLTGGALKSGLGL